MLRMVKSLLFAGAAPRMAIHSQATFRASFPIATKATNDGLRSLPK
jgi:hypothetical protein